MAATTTTEYARGAWHAVAEGPGEWLLSSNEGFEYAAAGSSQPASSVVGHYRHPREELVVELLEGEVLWLRNHSNKVTLSSTAA